MPDACEPGGRPGAVDRPARGPDANVRAAALLLGLACGCGAGRAELRPVVRALRLHGVARLPEKDVRGHVVTRATSRWPFARKRYLSSSQLAEDRRRIEAFYQSRGYFRARVSDVRLTRRPSGAVEIDISVEEGQDSRVAGVRVAGLEPLGAAAAPLVDALPLRPGAAFSYDAYLGAKDLLLHRLREAGHAFAAVDGAVEVDRDARSVVIKLTARPGARAVFGDVKVVGAERIDGRLLEREAEVPQGARFDPEVLERARGRLHNLGLFSSVAVEPYPRPERPDVADVRVRVQESKLREIRLGAGLSFESQRTATTLEAAYTQRNFLGGLRVMRVALEAGYVVIPAFWDPQRHGPQVTLDARLTQPHALSRRSELQLSLGYDVATEYAYQYHGPRAQLGLTFSLLRERLRMGASYGFQLLDFFNTEEGVLEDPVRAGRLFGYRDPYRLGWLQEQISLDLRDRPLGARRGVYVALSAEQGGVYTGSAFDYQLLFGEARGYLPLGERLTLAARLQFGHIFTQGDSGSPITRRFYAGGSNSHRGFNYNRLSRQVPACGDGCTDPPIPIGGDQMFIGQTELRLDVVRLFGSWLSLVAFFDLGDVAAPGGLVDFTKLHYAAGGGLRYATLIGTLRFDLGARLNRLEEGNPDAGSQLAFHISIGEAF